MLNDISIPIYDKIKKITTINNKKMNIRALIEATFDRCGDT